jgi:hypothetical protein
VLQLATIHVQILPLSHLVKIFVASHFLRDGRRLHDLPFIFLLKIFIILDMHFEFGNMVGTIQIGGNTRCSN